MEEREKGGEGGSEGPIMNNLFTFMCLWRLRCPTECCLQAGGAEKLVV